MFTLTWRFAQDTCASEMTVGVALFKRTDNLSESEPRMAPDWSGFRGGQNFSVPLHDKDRQYRNVTTGLVKVQPDNLGRGFVSFMKSISDPNLPNVSYPDHASWEGFNGCAL